jgi:Tol biopolymer transport system component
MNADGSGRHDVSRNPDAVDRSPAWSPDGRSIAFATGPQDGADGYLDDIWLMSLDLFLLDLASGRLTKLTRGAPEDVEPAFSPDGRRIAFASLGRGSRPGGLYLMRVLDRRVRRLTCLAGDEGDPAWQPRSATAPPGRG